MLLLLVLLLLDLLLFSCYLCACDGRVVASVAAENAVASGAVAVGVRILKSLTPDVFTPGSLTLRCLVMFYIFPTLFFTLVLFRSH